MHSSLNKGKMMNEYLGPLKDKMNEFLELFKDKWIWLIMLGGAILLGNLTGLIREIMHVIAIGLLIWRTIILRKRMKKEQKIDFTIEENKKMLTFKSVLPAFLIGLVVLSVSIYMLKSMDASSNIVSAVIFGTISVVVPIMMLALLILLVLVKIKEK